MANVRNRSITIVTILNGNDPHLSSIYNQRYIGLLWNRFYNS
jgi:hypothetical protein